MIRIEKIAWLDKDNYEGFIYLADDTFKLNVFSDGTPYSTGEVFQDEIFIFDEKEVIGVDTNSASAQITAENDQELVGKLLGAPTKRLLIGDFMINLTGVNIPNDMQDGDFMQIIATRLDTY